MLSVGEVAAVSTLPAPPDHRCHAFPPSPPYRREHATAGRSARKPRAKAVSVPDRSAASYFLYPRWTFRVQPRTPLKLRSGFASGGAHASTVSNRYFFACLPMDVGCLLNETRGRERHRFDDIKSRQ